MGVKGAALATIISQALSAIWVVNFLISQETLPSLFIPNTYEVYWNMSADAFMKRMQKEHAAFWNNDRLKRAQHIGLTPEEVSTLSS